MHRRKMKLSLELACFIFLSALSFTLAASPSASTNSSAKCPMDLNYVTRIPWNSSVCRNFHPNSTSKTEIAKQNCCVSLLSVFGIGLAQHLKETSLFQLPNLPTSVSCLQDFQSKLNSLSLPGNLASLCFEPMQFVITPDLCAHIQTTQDWVAKLGESTALDQACRSDLSDLTACDTCLRAGNEVQTKLSSTASSIASKRGMWETGNTEHHEHAFLHRLKLVHWQKLGKWKSFACSFARASVCVCVGDANCSWETAQFGFP
ncbi:hypothetical protein SCA6_006351 [Theobroma cacao]